MEKQRIRRKTFDPAHESMGLPMYWLSKRDVSGADIAFIFGKTVNDVSVNAYNQELREKSGNVIVPPPKPDIQLASPEIVFPSDKRNDDLEEKIESEGARFWTEVRGLQGTVELGKILRKINKPGVENIHRHRLKARVQHLLAEMYLHAGYLKTSIDYCRSSLETRLKLYNDTHYRTELFAYAKTMLLFTCALEVSGESGSILHLLDDAEAAFRASNSPIDPELHRQRATVFLNNNKAESARKEYLLAFETYPAHREFLGFEASGHARYDVGLRPMAILDRDHDAAMNNLKIAQTWPEGDIHRSTNLNIAIASAFFTDSVSVQAEALELLPAAWAAAEGYGRQMTTVRLLELLPKIPRRLQSQWALFALRYNAYRKM